MNPLSKKITLLNAPKGAGKDTIGAAMEKLYGCELRSFKTSLYECSYPFTNFTNYSEFVRYCTDRELKEKPTSFCRGMSPRDFLIYISEKIVKPHFGKQFFGRKAAMDISLRDLDRGVVFTDSGFVEEAAPIIKEFGGRNVFVIQFTGQNSEDFSGDSRDFIDVHNCHTIKMRQSNDFITPERYAMLITQEILKYG